MSRPVTLYPKIFFPNNHKKFIPYRQGWQNSGIAKIGFDSLRPPHSKISGRLMDSAIILCIRISSWIGGTIQLHFMPFKSSWHIMLKTSEKVFGILCWKCQVCNNNLRHKFGSHTGNVFSPVWSIEQSRVSDHPIYFVLPRQWIFHQMHDTHPNSFSTIHSFRRLQMI